MFYIKICVNARVRDVSRSTNKRLRDVNMKNFRKFLILIFALTALCSLCFALSSCKNGSLAKKLEMPLNVRIEINHRRSGTEYMLYWDAVSGAEKYSITVNGKKAESKTPSVNATELMTEGTYSRVYVKAVGNGFTTRDSDENKPVLFAEKVSDVLVFQLSEDETHYSVSSYAMDKESLVGKIVMPDFYNGLPVEEIAANAFFTNDGGVVNPSTGVGCNNVTTSFRFPKYLKKIGDFAFSYCTVVRDIQLPETVTEIGNAAFYTCTRLQNINLRNVTSIGAQAFDGCQSLTKVELSSDLRYFGLNAFDKTPMVTNAVDDVIVMGNLLYSAKNKEITEYAVPETVTKFASGAFYNCTKLKTLDYTHDVEFLGEGIFYGCEALEAVKISEGTKILSDYTFYKCAAITEIKIPETVEKIGNGTFSYCSGLETVVIPEGVTSIGESAFSYCSKLTEITLPDSVTSIGSMGFMENKALTSVKLSSKLTKIAPYTFLNCPNLVSVVIPEGVTEIEYAAFAQCYKLNYVVLPKSLKKLNYSFVAYSAGCKSIFLNCSPEEYEAIEEIEVDPNGNVIDTKFKEVYTKAKRYFYSENSTESYLSWRYVDGVPTPWNEA